jgi:hypothetical protein
VPPLRRASLGDAEQRRDHGGPAPPLKLLRHR